MVMLDPADPGCLPAYVFDTFTQTTSVRNEMQKDVRVDWIATASVRDPRQHRDAAEMFRKCRQAHETSLRLYV